MNHPIRRPLTRSLRLTGLLGGCLVGFVLLTRGASAASAASVKTYHPTRTDDPAPNGCKKKDCSLREAVIAADTDQGGKIVLRPGKRYMLTRRGAGENNTLTGDLDLHFPGIEVTTKGRRGPMATIDANGIDRVFAGDPILDRVIMRDGHARVGPGDNGNGGAVVGYPTVTDSRFINNTADGRGGAIYFDRGPSEIDGSVFKGNAAASDGGAVYFFQACNGPENHLDFRRSRATRNSAGGAGGGIFSYCNADVSRSKLDANSARGPGGGIFSPGTAIPPEATLLDPSEWWSRVEMFDSTLAGNRSGSYGGGLALAPSQSSTYILGSTISGNSANSGGGIGSFAATAVQDSTIANNRADRNGGGIGVFASDSRAMLDFVTVARNVADVGLNGGSQGPGVGGGLFQEVGATVSVDNTIIALNHGTLRTTPGQDCYTFATPFQSLGHNLIGDARNCSGFGASGDLFGGKLKLAKLSGNGGPTKTIALNKGSRAINHGSSDALFPPSNFLIPAYLSDQRGFTRGRKPDIGAFERGAKPPRTKKKK